MPRRILHVDFNSFYASVACRLNPVLRPHPVAVAGDPEKRHGVILAKNEHAKKFGVRTGEPIWQARQKCPRLVVVPPDFAAYKRFSEQGRRIYREYSDCVEGFGLDENWVDVSPITRDFDDARLLANDIRRRIVSELGITVSVGVASNKVFSKLGSDIKKPDAVTVVSPDNYKRVAWPQPVRALLYVGHATEAKLSRYGIATIGELAAAPEGFLKSQFGKCGLMLHAFANGRDISPVLRFDEVPPPKSIGNGITTPRDLADETDVYLTVYMLTESVAARLRAQGCRARCVQLAVRDTRLYTFTRQQRLPHATDITAELVEAAMSLFRANYSWTVPVRALSVTATELVSRDEPMQLSLFDDEHGRMRKQALEAAVDGIRSRYGYRAIGRALFLSPRYEGLADPLGEAGVHPVGYLQNGSMDEVAQLNGFAGKPGFSAVAAR